MVDHLSILQIVERHRGYIIHRAAVAVAIQKATDGATVTAQESAQKTTESAGVNALLLFPAAEITHYDRGEHHQNLRGAYNNLSVVTVGLISVTATASKCLVVFSMTLGGISPSHRPDV